jgi:hypothetical protein
MAPDGDSKGAALYPMCIIGNPPDRIGKLRRFGVDFRALYAVVICPTIRCGSSYFRGAYVA